MMAMRRRSGADPRCNLSYVQACRISSVRSGDTFITKHFPGSLRTSPGRKYSVRMETGPDMRTECGVFAGIHTARIGGTTQRPGPVETVITPWEAKMSWSSGCECSMTTWPFARSAEMLATWAMGRPRRSRSRLGHLCDISCQNSESNLAGQAIVLVVKQMGGRFFRNATGRESGRGGEDAEYGKDDGLSAHQGLRQGSGVL